MKVEEIRARYDYQSISVCARVTLLHIIVYGLYGFELDVHYASQLENSTLNPPGVFISINLDVPDINTS